jgi:mannose-binding lectin 2
MTPTCARAVLAAVLVAASDSFSHLSEHSFEPPFNSFDRDGIRRIDGWKYGGAAGVNEHFVRLTPDRQSKKGWLWNDAKVMADGWSATLRFRISGQGRAMYGDGLAFWFTTDSFYVPGDLHGHSDTFRGFAVIFDTFRNHAPGHAHKDILLLTSTGESPVRFDATGTPPLGCDADVRFWEGRQDFSVANRSAARVTFNGSDNSVSVYVDARGSGDWRPCIERVPLPLPANWWRAGGLGRGAGGAYMGLTASTGDLADNHDLLSLHVGLEDEVAPEGGAAGREGHIAIISSGSPEVDAAIRSVVDRETVRLNERLLYMHHHLEHAMSSTGDSLKLAIRKLNEQEAALERRLQDLERRVVGAVSREVRERAC